MFEADLIGDDGKVIKLKVSIDIPRSTALVEVGDRAAQLTHVDLNAGFKGKIEIILYKFTLGIQPIYENEQKVDFVLKAAGIHEWEHFRISGSDIDRFNRWIIELKL